METLCSVLPSSSRRWPLLVGRRVRISLVAVILRHRRCVGILASKLGKRLLERKRHLLKGREFSPKPIADNFQCYFVHRGLSVVYYNNNDVPDMFRTKSHSLFLGDKQMTAAVGGRQECSEQPICFPGACMTRAHILTAC